MFLSQSCSVFVSCDISTVTVLIRGSRELPCCNLCLHSKRTCIIPYHALHYHLILTRGSGAALAAVERVSGLLYLVQMSTFGEGSHGGEETAVPAVGGDQQQHSMGQISRLLGRPKCFSGREDEWHDWSLKFGAIAATLSDHASVWMNGALQHTTEITLDQPDEASARFFCTTDVIPFSFICVRDDHWQSFAERLITMVWKRGDYCMMVSAKNEIKGFGVVE